MRLVSFPYYYDLEGQIINGVTLQSQHVKLFGLISVLEQGQYGCIAGTDYLAKVLRTSDGVIRKKRADLIKAGLIEIVRRKNTTEIEEIKTVRFNLETAINNRGMLPTGNIDVTHREHAMLPTGNIDNREATPVGNNNINNNGITSFSLRSNDDTKVELEPTEEHSPFDEEVDEVVSLKPAEHNKENKIAGALVGELCKIVGADNRGQNVAVANTKKLLNKGFTPDEIKGMVEWTVKDEFYHSKPLHTRLGNDAMQQYLMTKENKAERPKNDGEGMVVVW